MSSSRWLVFRRVTALLGSITLLPTCAVAVYVSAHYYQQIVLGGAGGGCNAQWWCASFAGSVWFSPAVACVLDVIVSRRVHIRDKMPLVPIFACLSLVTRTSIFALFRTR